MEKTIKSEPMNSTNKSLLEENISEKTQAKLSNGSYHLTQARLKHLMTASPAVIYSCDPEEDFSVNFVSENIKEQLGYEPREFIEDTKFWVDRIHPEDKPNIFTEIKKLYERGNFSQEYRFLHKDGTYRWLHDAMSLNTDDEGKPIEIVGSWVDITDCKQADDALERLNIKLKDQVSLRAAELEKLNHSIKQEIKRRKETEKELRDSQAIYQSLIKNADIYLTAISKEGVYIATSERNAKRLIDGAKPEDIIGKSLYDVHPQERADEYMEEIREMCRSGKGNICERLEPHSGSERWHRINFCPIKDANDEIIGIHAVSYDIHDQKLAQEKLWQERNLLRTIIDSLPNLIYIRDIEGRFLTINKEYARNFGLKNPDEAVGRKLADLISPEMEASAEESLAEDTEILSSGQPLIDKERITESAIGKKYQLSTKMPWSDEQGKILGIVGSALDVSYLKETEKALSGERNLLRTLIDQLPFNIFIKDIKGKFIVINKAYANYLKLKDPMEAIGESILKLLPPMLKKEGKMSLEEDKEIITSGQPMINKERKYKNFNGESIWELTTKIPLIDSEGKAIGVMGISLDITEKKQTESTIIEQAALIDKAHDAIIVRDLDNRVMYWNKASELLYGYTAEEAKGRNSEELFYKNSPPKIPEMEKELREKGEWYGEINQLKRDNTPIIVDCSKTLVRDEDGNPTSILTINTDVTERKKLEAQILRVQRVEGIGTLASGIAHDLNNLLAPISLSSEMLLNDARDNISKKRLSIIMSSVDRASSVVNQLLTFARGIGGEHSIIQPKHILMEMVQIAKETFPKNINIFFVIPHDIWSVKANPTQLHQVILNLCLNSRDSMSDGGNLYLMAENVHLDESYVTMFPDAKAGHYVEIEITDTGVGMSNNQMGKIFDPFYTTKKEGHGTGLGLSTSHGIVKSHGGFISVESEEDKGSTFKVYLPAETTDNVITSRKKHTSFPKARGELILVVDDENHICEMIREVLETQGYKVLTAEDGTEALAIYAKYDKEIRSVLTDIAMPHLDGVAVVQTLKKLNPELEIIVSTGEVQKDKIQKMKNLGIIYFLEKPYTTEALISIVHKSLAELNSGK